MSPEHFRALAHALKLVKPRKGDFDNGYLYQGIKRQWIEAVGLQADILAAYGFARTDFMDLCDL